ncbi:MAG: MCE family protein [Aeromicrobium sp.]
MADLELGRRRRQVVGASSLLGLALMVTLLLAIYAKTFESDVDVNLRADRAGLLLDPGADVRAFGVPVGRVRSVSLSDDNRAHIVLAIRSDQADRIPRDTPVSIRASTVFGAKFVDLQVPRGSVADPITAGSTLSAADTTIEINDVFQHALSVLETVKPLQLQHTLGTLATALDGRGASLGRFLSEVNLYLGALDPSLPRLNGDLGLAASVLDTYADVAPDLIATLDNASTTSDTIHDKSAVLSAFLVDLTRRGHQIRTFADLTEEPLNDAAGNLRPVLGLAQVYAPELGCLIFHLQDSNVRLSTVISDVFNSAQAFAGFLPAQAPYTTENLPRLAKGTGPRCFPQPTTEHPTLKPEVLGDGVPDVYDPSVVNGSVSDPSLLVQNLIGDFFGPQALASLLEIVGSHP